MIKLNQKIFERQMLMSDKKKNTTQKKANEKKKETIIICAIVIAVVALCVGLIVLVLRGGLSHGDENGTEGNTTSKNEQSSDSIYPAYKDADDVDTEGAYYNTTNTGVGTDVDMDKISSQIDAYDYSDFAKTDEVSDFVVIRIKNHGDIIVALREDIATDTVQNFKKLVSSGYYKDTIINKVTSTKIHGGIETTDKVKKDTDSIYGEFTANNYENNLLHKRGIISMARNSGADRNSTTSEFFIMYKDSADLDTYYPAFGFVAVGLDVVDEISNVNLTKDTQTEDKTRPATNVVIEDMFFVEPIKGTGLAVATKPTYKTIYYEVIIRDDDGDPVSGASIKLVDVTTGRVPVHTLTNSEGKVRFKLEPSEYRVYIVSANGYEFDETHAYALPAGTTGVTIKLSKISED